MKARMLRGASRYDILPVSALHYKEARRKGCLKSVGSSNISWSGVILGRPTIPIAQPPSKSL